MNSREIDNIGGVTDFVESLGVTYDIGLESVTTPTYEALAANYEGLNPFPLTVVVGKDGKILYVTREYDADALEVQIQAALAE